MKRTDVRITVVLPRMLADVLGEERLDVRGATIEAALEAAYRRLPILRHHLCDESGELRVHILCALDGVASRDPAFLRAPLPDGAEIRIVQAISGG